MDSKDYPDDLLNQVRDMVAEREVLLIADTPATSLPEWIGKTLSSRDLLQETTPQDALGLVLSPWVKTDQLDAVIARLRDLLVREFCVLHPGDETEQTQHMGALGLHCMRMTQFADQPWGLNHFDLKQYKKTPDWLNSRYWANPELWGRFRW